MARQARGRRALGVYDAVAIDGIWLLLTGIGTLRFADVYPQTALSPPCRDIREIS
jgi:hypothetical protein